MATEFRIEVIETDDKGNSESQKMGLVDFITKVHSATFNEPTKVYHDCYAKQGQKIKAIADKEAFTISLVTPTGKDAKDIEIKLNALKNNITIKSSDGLKVNGLDEMVFSGSREKASFEYDYSVKSWILW